MTFPSDLDIFSPFTVRWPCEWTVFGSGRPAASRMAGQMTVWNQMMSLPMMWTFAGQYFLKPAPG
jgi:hypothetical protein